MRLSCIAIGLGLVTFVDSAMGDESAFPQVTQMGPWSCTSAGDTIAASEGDCKFKFPKPFAGNSVDVLLFENSDYNQRNLPTEELTPFENGRYPFRRIKPKDISADGFTIVLESRPQTKFYGSYIAIGPGSVPARVTPKYLVLTIIYAPPGMKGSKGTGVIAYQEDSTIGTTTSSTRSFKQGYTVSAEVNGGYLFTKGGNQLNVSYANTVTDKQSLDIKVSQQGGLQGKGADDKDGVNNDNDVIYVAINPTIDLQLAPSLVQWTFANSKDMLITHVYAAWLKDLDSFKKDAPAIKQMFDDAKFEEKDYKDILNRDPFAAGIPPDPKRYELRTGFDYVPPHPCQDQPLTKILTFRNQTTSTDEHIVQDEYQVDITHKDQAGKDDVLSLKMELQGKWTWTNQSSTGSSISTAVTATLAAGAPNCGFYEANYIDVYYDKVYRTYAFVQRKELPSLQGKISVVSPPSITLTASAPDRALSIAATEVAPAPTPATEVRLVDASGHERRTFANASGEWNFFGPLSFPVTVMANGITTVYRQALPGADVKPQTMQREKFIRE
jgi:hypothetical protein